MRDEAAELSAFPAENLTVQLRRTRFTGRNPRAAIKIWNDWQPDYVFQPSVHDVHQITRRSQTKGYARSGAATIRYEIPWNNFDFSYQAYIALERGHVERKVAALEKYASQQHRRYANAEYVWNVARTHGINVNREYAEVFQVYRVVA